MIEIKELKKNRTIDRKHKKKIKSKRKREDEKRIRHTNKRLYQLPPFQINKRKFKLKIKRIKNVRREMRRRWGKT